MDGDTEKDTAEEKESDDTEPSGEEGAGRLHQNGGSSEDNQDLPIMQWEDLSLRIAELEKQEEERRESAKSTSGSEQGSVSGGGAEERQGGLRRREEWEDYGRCRVTVVSSRFQNHKNLQLCYTNNSESEDDEEEEEEEEEEGAGKEGSKEAGNHGYRPSGLKLEVRAALSALKNKLLSEQKEKHLACSSVMTTRKHLEFCDMQICSIQQLNSLRTSLNHNIHDLSSELVGHLLIRDQLRTKQDAMLLDVQDLT